MYCSVFYFQGASFLFIAVVLSNSVIISHRLLFVNNFFKLFFELSNIFYILSYSMPLLFSSSHTLSYTFLFVKRFFHFLFFQKSSNFSYFFIRFSLIFQSDFLCIFCPSHKARIILADKLHFVNIFFTFFHCF